MLSTEHNLIGHRIEDAQVAQDVLGFVPSNSYHVPVNKRAKSAFLIQARASNHEDDFLTWEHSFSDKLSNDIKIASQKDASVFADCMRQIIERDLCDTTPDDHVESVRNSGVYFGSRRNDCAADVPAVGREA